MRLKIKNLDKIIDFAIGYKDWVVSNLLESDEDYIFLCKDRNGNSEILILKRTPETKGENGRLLWAFKVDANSTPVLMSRDWMENFTNVLTSIAGQIKERREMSI